MKCDKKAMLLYGVTDRTWVGKMTLYEQVEAALRNGMTCLQLREKNLPEEQFLEEAVKFAELCRNYRVPFIINDNVDIAVKCGADGVHVGQDDMNVSLVRERVGDKMIIGVSVHNVEEAVKAVSGGADYLGIGAVFPTSTKTDANVMSTGVIREICNAVDVPTVAIGGINSSNIMKLSGSGVDGIAVVSAIFGAESPGNAAAELRRLSEKMVG